MNKVSILLAVYNCDQFITEAVNSIINQTYRNWELVIVNNGSTDNTAFVASSFTQKDDRIIFHDLPEKGKCNAYNKAFELCTGDFICFFAGDDMLSHDSLQKRIAPLEMGLGDFSTCLLKTFSSIDKHNGVVFPKKIMNPNYSGGSIFFSRAIAKTIFPIPIELPNEDTWTSLHLRAFGKNVHIPEVLYLYRIHNANSYGYDLEFDEKRDKYLNRMQAFIYFKEKWKNLENKAFEQYVNIFIKGLEFCKQKNRIGILSTNGLSLRDKMVLFFYSSPIIYKLRHKFFKLFSGILH
ncbi:MAG: glycosyltransferase [Sphingobacteriia bacterium]|jgi:glycosyltransferase involved in cell wall biosynthesis